MYDNALTFAPVRSSEIADLVAWRREVIGAVFGPQNEIAMNTLLAENERYFDEAIVNGDHLAVFALIGGERVGCGSLCFHDELPSPDNPTGRCAYVMNVYVRPEFRRRGIGKLIVLWLVDQARMRGISKIYLESTIDAKPMYRSIGFVDMPDYMIYRAGTEAPAVGTAPAAYSAALTPRPPAIPETSIYATHPAPAAQSLAGAQPVPVAQSAATQPAALASAGEVAPSPQIVGAQPAPAPHLSATPDVTAVMPPIAGDAMAAEMARSNPGGSTLVSAPDASAIRPLSSCAVASFLLGLIAALSSAIPFISLEEFAETVAMMRPVVDIVTLVFGGCAIVLGILGLVFIARGRLRGRALAIIGLIVGVAACAIVITLFVMATLGGQSFDFDVSDFYRLG